MNIHFQSTQLQKVYLKKGDRNSQVIDLQRYLIHWGCYKGPLDGIFDQDVEFGVLRFQFQFFLEEDGIVGPKTWQVLQTGVPLNMPILQLGSWGKQVLLVQEILTITTHYSGLVTGQFDAITTEAVNRFQRSVGLKVDGIVGPKTWQALCKIPRPYPPVRSR